MIVKRIGEGPNDVLVRIVCSCGRWVGLSVVEGDPVAWHIVVPGAPEKLEPEHGLAAMATYTRVTICDCGQQYRALDGSPWIAAVE